MLTATRLRADRNTWIVAVLAGAIVLWAVLALNVERLDLSLYAREASVGVETAVALSSLLGALVLSLFPTDGDGIRLRWVAAGFVVMGIGALLFGVLGELLSERAAAGVPVYAWLLTRSVATAMFVAGVAFARTPKFSRRPLLISLAAIGVLGIFLYAGGGSAVPTGEIGLWYWLLSALPLGLASAAVAGSVRNREIADAAAWLPVAMVLLAGSQLHSLFWPSAFSPILTPVDLLRLAFAALVAVGAILELRRFASERASLLATERQRAQRLGELAALKADFTAMVAHEFDSPLAAIGGFTDMLSVEGLGPEDRRGALSGIRTETELLRSLVEDVRAAATIERDDFAVRPRPVEIGELLEDAAVFARNLPGEHPVTFVQFPERVWADRERMGQVLRNLLTNAAKFSSAKSPITLRAIRNGGRVRIEVADHGAGVHPDDMARIFEKFGRGRDRLGRPVPGVGLGLYLSSRIVRAHGSSLEADSTPGEGSVFSFELEIIR